MQRAPSESPPHTYHVPKAPAACPFPSNQSAQVSFGTEKRSATARVQYLHITTAIFADPIRAVKFVDMDDKEDLENCQSDHDDNSCDGQSLLCHSKSHNPRNGQFNLCVCLLLFELAIVLLFGGGYAIRSRIIKSPNEPYDSCELKPLWRAAGNIASGLTPFKMRPSLSTIHQIF